MQVLWQYSQFCLQFFDFCKGGDVGEVNVEGVTLAMGKNQI